MGQKDQSMEDRLLKLVETNNEENRATAAKEWKAQGKKVMGTLCAYVPEEIIFAAGILPWRITGTWRENVPSAAVHRPLLSCSYCSHALEPLLTGELDFLDGVVATSSCDNLRRLWDVYDQVGKLPFSQILHLPHQNTELAYGAYQKALTGLRKGLEELIGAEITDESIRHAIEVYNKMRSLLMRVYELRKRETPAILGSEVVGLVTAGMIMPKEEYISELETLLPYLEQREVSLPTGVRVRLLLAGPILPVIDYIRLIEDLGALVVMDDLCNGSRYFWGMVDTSLEPVYALAKRYVSRPPCARMFFQDKHLDQVIDWVKDFGADGVFHFPLMYCDPWLYTYPYFEDRLKEADIPVLNVSREHAFGNVGQLQTRVEAFVEMIEVRKLVEF